MGDEKKENAKPDGGYGWVILICCLVCIKN